MQDTWVVIVIILAGTSIAAFLLAGLRLRNSALRINRSLDPLMQKAKTLKIEASALKRSRLDRQRRLEGTSSNDSNPEK